MTIWHGKPPSAIRRCYAQTSLPDPGAVGAWAAPPANRDRAERNGFKTAFVRRPDEWGAAGPPDPEPNPAHDIIVDSFPELAEALGVAA